MANLEELVIRIRADTAQLEREMKKAQGVVQQSAGGMKTALSALTQQARALAPALSVAAVVAFTRSALVAADQLNDLAQRTGVAASTLSALNIPLLQGGSSVDEFAASINRMNNMVGEAAKGINQDAIKAFDDLGLSIRKLETLSPEQQFFEVARALSEMGSQSEMTNAGMAIFGRSFATLIPLIKESGGNLEDFISKMKDTGDALTDEQLARIDKWGDKWVSVIEHAKLAVVDFLDYFYTLGEAHRRFFEDMDLPKGASFTRPNVPSDEELARNVRKQLGMPEPSARGSNKGILKSGNEAKQIDQAKESLRKYNEELRRQHEYSMLAPDDAAERKAYYDLLDLAQKAGIKNAEEYAAAHSKVAKEMYKMAQAQEEAARFAAELKDQFAETAGNIIFDSKNAGDALNSLGQALARMIAQRYILGPLTDSLFGSPGGGGGGFLGDLFGGFFAEGGRPPMGKASIVGENGPELFVPDTAGTIIPNGAMSGQSVQVTQVFQINPGVPELINARIREAAPMIASAAHDAVFTSINRGGKAAKISGRR